jgi:hypothetical protein
VRHLNILNNSQLDIFVSIPLRGVGKWDPRFEAFTLSGFQRPFATTFNFVATNSKKFPRIKSETLTGKATDRLDEIKRISAIWRERRQFL